jgi:molybdate transport system regulatory protein
MVKTTGMRHLRTKVGLMITDKAYEARRRRTGKKKGHAGVICKGIVELLEGVEESGSLYLAAKHIGMAYSKAWYLMRDTEESIGFKLIDRNGANGSTLTAEGERMLYIYHQIEKECAELAQRRLGELVDEPLPQSPPERQGQG